MSKPWKVRRGIYELVDDSFANRRELENHLTIKFKKDGFKPKGILYGKDKTPQRISTASQKNVVKNPEGNKLKIKVSNPETLRGSDMKQQISENATEGFRKQDIERGKEALQSRSRVGSIAKNVGKVEAHHTRMLQMYRPFFEGLPTKDRAALADFAFQSKFALGNDISNRSLLSEPLHDQIHDFMRKMGYQVNSKKIKAGYKYPGVPDLGNNLESRRNALTHFFKNVQEPIERKLNTIKWSQEDAIKPLTKKEMEYASSWLDDKLLKRELKLPKADVTELGRPLGGIGDKLKIAANKIPKRALQIGGAAIGTLPLLGTGVDAAQFGSDLHTAVKKPTGKNIANTIGSGLELADQTPFMIGPLLNASIRSKKNVDMSNRERMQAINKLKFIK
jgi:hypothetical protein